ncbi:flagellar basal-body MS-ring/collar protein FliF [Polynucleobacter sp. AP-Sanab-80-C2]|uniref:flagellar basal-body MS-ring/collar protein FliF n=1 Tax=Polynucleobacter sp. AP-Sanab-80-C2 TaxID=3108274 RepID=UPI002B2332B3|nr:flagellar basal-body MS-ring/collar protein FliF [Polynucleobacter sp. AP-Sanab-80-C2]MEA9599064.1 flagellar basal-body MS-ring/collar protein FliF [Polynucleobacter sp. AP-Sanab-80-C2]
MESLLARLNLQGTSKKVLLSAGIAAVIAIMAVFWIWSQGPKYKVVFSNFNDKDGGAIVSVLEQQNIPYKLADGGASILVPAELVYQTRLKLAAMGLPRGGNVGFELLENQKFGVSQFVEQVNFQRALEGELERSIQSISGVEGARVHLAIPKTSVFVRDAQKPTASVLVKLMQGRTLDQNQVSAIAHLISSSVPNLSLASVDIVDQTGSLLSDAKKGGSKTLDANQLKYVEDLQKNIVSRVQAIITPIVGEKNVRAEANVEIDFSNTEEANEIYKPNQKPEVAVIRSLQTNESIVPSGSTNGGVPGALSNQPPANATAPLNTTNNAAPGGAAAGAGAGANNAAAQNPMSTQRNSITNYEIDKTISFTQKSMGGVKRLSVGIVVNNKADVDAEGKPTTRPLNDAEKQQIIDLAKQAMGFNETRGDTLSVVNTPFTPAKEADVSELPVWKDPVYIEMAKNIGQILVGLIVLFIMYRKAIKPMLANLLAPDEAPVIDDSLDENGRPIPKLTPYQKDLKTIQALAKENPKVVADVVAGWVGNS